MYLNVLKRVLIGIFFIVISFILQTTVFQWFSFGGIVPNLLIILTATYGFIHGDRAGIIVGFFCGLLTDIFFSSYIGINAIFYMYIGYLNGKFHQVFYEDDIKLPLTLIFSSDLLYGISYYVILFLLRSRFDFAFYFTNTILPEAIYTILVALVYYQILLFTYKLLKKGEEKEGMRFV